MIAITEVTRRVHITRRSIQQTLIEGEIGVQWPGVDSENSLLVISENGDDMTRVGDASMVVESTYTDDSREKISRTSRHHCYDKKVLSVRQASRPFLNG